jgi:hypothetical protein
MDYKIMNYELAKKLKDAGFNQKGNGYYDCLCDDYMGCGIDPKTDELYEECPKGTEVYFPILSELIEGCGESFSWLIKTIPEYSDINGKWVAQEIAHRDRESYKCSGNTPEEAVANLWLQLHGN